MLECIKEEPLLAKPRRVFKELMDVAGGPLHSSSASSEPCNLQQIYNARKTKRTDDKGLDFTHLLSQVKESSFVHDLTIDSDSVQYILATERQLKDLELLCMQPIKFSVFSIDSTYYVGNFYVTNTCFENLKVVHAESRYKEKHPLEMGPRLIHTEKNTNNFIGFCSSLLRMNHNLRTIQAIGSDGYDALMNSILICFQDTQKLLCSNHKKENIQRKLKNEFRSREAAANHIISDIFGKDSGSIYERGLIDSTSTEEFDRGLMNVKVTWDCPLPQFHSWFVKYEADIFKAHLFKAFTKLARIENHFLNNRVESVNDNVKDWIGRSGRLSLPAANNKIQEYLNVQQQEFELIIYADGPYELADSHNNLRQSRHVWNSVSTENRRSALNAFWSPPVVGSATTKSALKMSNVCTETISINTEEKVGSMKLSLDVNDI